MPPRTTHAAPSAPRYDVGAPDACDSLALVAHGIDVVVHRHSAVQLVVSLDAPYDATIGGTRVHATRGFLVDVHVPHACDSARSTVLVTSVDATTQRGDALRQLLPPGRAYVDVDALLPRAAVTAFAAGYAGHRAGDGAAFDPLALLAPITGPPRTGVLDVRLRDALGIIRDDVRSAHALPRVRASGVAAAAGVSERRMRDLFRTQLGIPFATFVLWTRIKRALGLMTGTDTPLGTIAHAAGFADQAHFTRTFRRMFGVSPSVLRAHTDILHVFA